jgi:hypothetical protein
LKFRFSIENFRGLAIFFVMLSHVGSLRQLGGVGEFLYFAVVDATTWFVFISGYLFFYIENQRFEYTSYLLKKAKYVILPYLILSVPAIGAGLYFGRDQLLALSPLGYVLWSLVVGGSVVGPMWFIPMITLFFLLSWVFKKLGRTKLIYPITIIALVVSLFSSRPIGDLNPFLSFVHFLGFYLLGMSIAVASKSIDEINSTSKGCLLVALGLIIFFAAAWGFESNVVEPMGFQEGWGKLNLIQLGKLSFLVVVFLLFERYLVKPQKILGYLAEISFGLFFIHGFLMLIFLRIGKYLVLSNPFAMFVLEFSLVVLGSMLVVFSIKFVLGKQSRYVIGC